jgi:hypothetical protein
VTTPSPQDKDEGFYRFAQMVCHPKPNTYLIQLNMAKPERIRHSSPALHSRAEPSGDQMVKDLPIIWLHCPGQFEVTSRGGIGQSVAKIFSPAARCG